MNNFLKAMSADMRIKQYNGETDNSLIYRLCYSALGQWCLQTARNSTDGIKGTTKHNQTIVLNELLQRYAEMFPSTKDMFVNANDPQDSLPVHIRKIYEQTGYLLTDDNNHNKIANWGRSIAVGNQALFFGIPTTSYSVNGLGVFSNLSAYQVSIRDFLIRDHLSFQEYFNAQFDIIDFYGKDIDVAELLFFNPLSKYSPSQSWTSEIKTDYAIARKTPLGPYYRVIKKANGNLLYADEPVESQDEIIKSSLTLYEFRRLYFTLKAHYGNPLKATVTQKDDTYSYLRLGGHLPNREYYFLLLLAWPVNNAFDKVNFITKNEFVPEITKTLESIGIKVEGGTQNA